MLDKSLRRELAENLHRLMEYRAMFSESFVFGQAVVCLTMLGGLAGEW